MMLKIGKVRISLPFVILMCVMYVFDSENLFFFTLFAVVIHELAHIVAIYACGASVDCIEIRAFGAKVNVPELEFVSYKKEIIIAAAGPLAGVITAALGAVAANVFGGWGINFFIGVNLMVSAINLIPVFPLDGGRMILSALLMFFSVRTAYIISYIIALICISAMFSGCVCLAFYGMLNPSLVIFSFYIAICGIRLPPLH